MKGGYNNMGRANGMHGPSYPGQPIDQRPHHRQVPGGVSPLTRSLWNKKGNAGAADDMSTRLTWQDLWVSVTNNKGDNQTLLHGLTGYAEPGSMLAIMGPSGSGKSTLLDSLAGTFVIIFVCRHNRSAEQFVHF